MIKLNGVQVDVTRFPDGTSQVWKLPKEEYSSARINWKFDHEGELFHLAQLVDLLRSLGVSKILLDMDFLPYGRQDKVISNKTTFALNTFAKIINTMGFHEVRSLDTHNPEVTGHLIRNFVNTFPFYEIGRVVNLAKPDVLCFPDAGAIARYAPNVKFLGKMHTFGNKERDQSTGYITKYELADDVTGQKCLIIDDICDGGTTFTMLAGALYDNGAASVDLYTTHGIYSKGLRPLKKAGIGRIFNIHGEVSEFGHCGALVYQSYDRMEKK